MNSDKIVIMDWGGVIESHKGDCSGWKARTEAIIKKLAHNENIILNSWGTFEINGKEHNINTINDDNLIINWIDYLIDKYNLNYTREEFILTYDSEYEKIEFFKDIIDILYDTKKYCNIGILSNLPKMDFKRLKRQIDLKRLDYVWLSYEIGIAKPNPKIYEVVEQTTGINPNNILFIDDDSVNITEAAKRGWNTLCASGSDKDIIKKAIDNFLGL